MADPNSKLTGLGILVDEKRVNDLLAQKTGAKAVVRSGCNLLLFVCFVTLFTVLALNEPLADFRAFEGYVKRRFDTMAAMPLHEVKSGATLWNYIEKSFLPGIYGNDTEKYYYPDYTLERFLDIESGNRLFGVGRMRMLKVKPDVGCVVASSKSSYFPTCYGPFDEEAIDTTSYGPSDSSTGEPVFVYYPGTASEYIGGQISSYPSGGFMEVITSNYNDTLTTVARLRDNDWIGAGSRVIVIDWNIYNFNLMLQAACRITFEIGASGRWIPTFDVDVLMSRHLNPIASRSTEDFLIILGEVILLLFVLFYLMEEASEFIGFRRHWPYIKWEYFGDAWNIIDWLNLILMIVTLAMKVDTWNKASGLSVYIGKPAKQSLSVFMDIGPVAANVRQIRKIIAFNTVLTWFKAVKYIAILPYITTFMQTVSKSQRHLTSFLMVFLSLLYGFVLAYRVAFGEQLAEFRTIWKSFVFLSGTFLGNSDLGLVYNKAPVLGSLLIWTFVIAMFFVSMNLFHAIMISALGDLKQEEGKQNKKWEHQVEKLYEFWKHFSETMRLEYRVRTCVPGLYTRCKARRKKAKEKERERNEDFIKRTAANDAATKVMLGPGDPSLGRRRKRAHNSLNDEDYNSDSDGGSDVDLGPLREKAQLRKGGRFGEFLDDGKTEAETETSGSHLYGLKDKQDEEPDEKAVELVIQATQYVMDGLIERTHGARGVLADEMAESKEVLQKISTVLDVLQNRTKDLELCQRQLLRIT